MADKYEELPEKPVASTSRPKPRSKPPFDDDAPSDTHSGEEDDDGSDDDDDDPVVRRLPVYYNPDYLQSLCLLQYPDRPPHPDSAHPLLPPALRPAWSNDPDPDHGRLATKFKPHTQHLELTLPIEKHPDRWNDDQAKHFAQGVVEERDRERERQQEKKGRRKRRDQQDDEDEQRYKEDKDARRLDKMSYSSSGVPEVTSYLIGVVKNDALHLNPVNQTFQLRPNLSYLDNILAQERRAKRAAAAGDDDDDDEVSDTELKKEEAKAVQVSIKQQGEGGKGPLGGGNGRAGAGLFAPMRAEEQESWKPLEHYHANTKVAKKAFKSMVAPSKQKLTSTTKPKEYLG
ncbi:hypothetical protein JCM8097_000755 [Rhodosporidiobolus ruineniae]